MVRDYLWSFSGNRFYDESGCGCAWSGHFGVDFDADPVTVITAHIAFGTLLGHFIYKWNSENTSIVSAIKRLFQNNRIEHLNGKSNYLKSSK